MTHPFITNLFSHVCPWLALVCGMQCLASGSIRRRGTLRLTILAVAAIGILAVPIQGFTIAGWIRGLEANFSLPLTSLLAVAVWKNEFSKDLLDSGETLTGWIFGFGGGLLLYPMALGVGKVDPYVWGWNFSPLFVLSGALTAWLIWKRNRFGIILLLSILAYHLRLLESRNYWDYLLDPVYVVAGMVALIGRLLARVRRKPPQPKAEPAP